MEKYKREIQYWVKCILRGGELHILPHIATHPGRILAANQDPQLNGDHYRDVE